GFSQYRHDENLQAAARPLDGGRRAARGKTGLVARVREKREPVRRRPKQKPRLAARLEPCALAAQVQLLDEGAIGLDVRPGQIVQQTATLGDESRQSAARVLVHLVNLQVLGEFGDAMREQGDLNARVPRVLFVLSEKGDDFGG